MKILFLTNNPLTQTLSDWLVINKKEDVYIFDSKINMQELKEICPDFIISYNYSYIIKSDVIDLYYRRIINLHTSLLPWNRGSYPNIWSWIDHNPCGVTIHFIDKGIDTGDILFQKEVYIDEFEETLRTSYHILHNEIQKLFMDNWDQIKVGSVVAKPQKNPGTIHTDKDFEKLKIFFEGDFFDVKIADFIKRYCKGANK